MNELDRLKVVLKDSFNRIKADMTELRTIAEKNSRTLSELESGLALLKSDYLPKDRVNLIKIKQAELEDAIKELRKLEERTVPKSLFEQRSIELGSEMRNRFKGLHSELEILKENSKAFLTRDSIRELIADINKEFNLVHAELAELRKIKETITARELDRRTAAINARIDGLAKELLNTNAELARKTTNEQTKLIVAELNRELDALRAKLAEVGQLRSLVGQLDSELGRQKGIAAEFAILREEFARLRKTAVSESRLASALEALDDRFIQKRVHGTLINSEVKRIRAELAAKQGGFRRTAKLASTAIVLGFVALFGAALGYLSLESAMADNFMLGALAAFVVGGLLKLVVFWKRR